MIELALKKDCTGCMSCVNSCPSMAIKIIRDKNGFDYPEINRDTCISCGKCMKSCAALNQLHSKNILKEDSLNDAELYAAINTVLDARMCASSGGIFEVLANYVIKNGGVVFGAQFDKDFNVMHSYTDSMDGVIRYKTSKYVQSYISVNLYKKCRDFLENKRLVLFSGTSCQVNGLYTFLKKDYDTLFTVDLICSGNTSPGFWENYLKYRKNKANSGIVHVNFRDKSFGWDRFSLKISFLSGKSYTRIFPNDEWAYFFLNHYIQRECCYSCRYKSIKHKADFTLGDFWGVQLSYPELYDDKGLSFIIVNSLKGSMLISSGELENIWIKKIPLTMVEKHNTAIVQSPVCPPDREMFLNDYNTLQFEKLLEKYVNIPIWKKSNIIFDKYWRIRIILGRFYRKYLKK